MSKSRMSKKTEKTARFAPTTKNQHTSLVQMTGKNWQTQGSLFQLMYFTERK